MPTLIHPHKLRNIININYIMDYFLLSSLEIYITNTILVRNYIANENMCYNGENSLIRDHHLAKEIQHSLSPSSSSN
jgi:hypothetical protein